jgi:type IV pilus assembly protein PilM
MPTPGSFLGIDLGAGSIKLVELRNEQGRARLVTYGMYEVPVGSVNDNNWSQRREQAVSVIKQLLEQTNAQSRLVVSALPTFEVFSSLITVPALTPKELTNAIRLEAKKVVPRPLDEMVLEWNEVGEASTTTPTKLEGAKEEELGTITNVKKAEQKKILLTAAPKDLVDSYVSIFKEAGLRLIGLETEAIALSRSLIGRDPSVVMVVDMGAQSTNLSIIEEGIAVVNRGVNFGGAQLTQKFVEKMGVEPALADQWKHDVSLTSVGGKLSPVLVGMLDDILHEIRYLFQLYRSQLRPDATAGKAGVEKIIMAGGSSFVPGLAEYLAEQLNVPVHLGDPWARIIYPEDLSSLLAQLGPSMAVSIGLAMREIVPK